MYTVYQLINKKAPAQSYIGMSGNIAKRMNKHQSRARGGYGSDRPIAQAIRRAGFHNFKLVLLAEYKSQRDARAHEMELIEALEPSLNVNA